MINPDDLALARDWAGDPGEFYSGAAPLKEVARVIQALPNQVADAAKIHKLIEQMKSEVENPIMQGGLEWEGGYVEATDDWVRELEALLPSPPRRPAMIKRGALAVHPEHGEVLVISNHPEDSGRVWVALDSEDSIDGSWTLRVQADELTDVDELSDSVTPETNNDSADDEEVDDSPEFDKTRKYRDRRGGTWEWDNDEHAWRRDFDGPMGETIYLDNLTDFSEYGPYTVVDESVPPARDFPQGAHYDAEGNATEPENVPAGEAWLVQTRYHDEPVPAFKRKSGTWVFIDRRGLSTWDEDRNIELIAPLVPKPEKRVLAPGGAIRFKPDKTKRYRDKDGSVWGWFVGWVCRDEDGNYEASSESSVPPAMHGPYTVVGGAADQTKGDNPEDTPCNGVDEDNPEDGDAPGGIIPTGDRPLAEIKIGNWAHHNTHGKVLITANAPNAFGLVRCVIPDDHSRIANLPITDLHQALRKASDVLDELLK